MIEYTEHRNSGIGCTTPPCKQFNVYGVFSKAEAKSVFPQPVGLITESTCSVFSDMTYSNFLEVHSFYTDSGNGVMK